MNNIQKNKNNNNNNIADEEQRGCIIITKYTVLGFSVDYIRRQSLYIKPRLV